MTIDSSGRAAYEANRMTVRMDEALRLAETSTELRQACEDFESMFVKIMLDSMRDTLSGGTLIPKNAGEKIFEDQLYGEYAKTFSRNSALGISEMMYEQLAADLSEEIPPLASSSSREEKAMGAYTKVDKSPFPQNGLSLDI